MEKADLILFNANVLRVDRADPQVRMVAAGNGRILAAGQNEDREGLYGPETRMIDCEGKTVIPGFHDAHMHLLAMVSSLSSLDCSPVAVSSIVDIQRAVAEKAIHTPQGKWVKAADYNEFYLEEKRHPTRWDLDKAAPAHPVKLAHRTRHACVLNSLGLAIAGITAQTPDPPGGLIDRETGTGDPTGLLFGMNTRLAENVIPPLSREEMDEGMSQASRVLLAAGITSIQDATAHNGPAQYRQLGRMKQGGQFRPRIRMMLGFDAIGDLKEQALTHDEGDADLTLGAVKIMLDEVSGSLNPPQPVLNDIVLRAHRAGLQVAIHAIEASTVEAAITAIEHALDRVPSRTHRHRIEHCSECPDHLIERLRQTGAMVVTQPAFLYFNGERYLAEVEPEKIAWLYRIGSWLKAPIRVAASSDAPIIPPNPLAAIHAAVARKARSGQFLLEDEGISATEALRTYTLGSAYAAFEEDIKGSISPGKLADLVMLSADPTQVPPDEIPQIEVLKTIIGGEIAWEAA